MSHPTLRPRQFFYPVGNSSAVCLTDNIPPEKSANVLLLGCGDPRNILYTLHADPPIHRPAVDFMCCDLEPAVIARNVLLFTLIYDEHPCEHIWNIFYHIKIDKSSCSLLFSQCRKLLGLCKDLESWQQSSYSRFLKFFSRYTLSQVHHYLGLYTQTETYPRAKHDQLFACFAREFEAHYGPHPDGIIPNTAKSAGPFATEVVRMLTRHFYHYWKTGTVSRSTTDIKAATFVNPTFVYSDSFTPSLVGDRCSLHYGAYPLEGFHLAAAFLTSSSPKTITEGQLIACARSQLYDWCSSFRTTVSQKSVTITLFMGDALALCQKLTLLRNASDIRLYVSPWRTTELVLDGDCDVSRALTSFDTIDTSNLVDHLGVLNVLIAAVPLLAHCPTAVLYTEFIIEKKEGNKASNLVDLLCADIPTISVLLGVSPAGCITQFTSTTRVHDILGGSSYRERFAWKCPYPIDSDGHFITPSFPNSLELGDVLFSMYRQMFRNENVGQLLKKPTLQTGSFVVHYHRATFAALLGLIKSRVQTDWRTVMEHIFDRMHTDHTLLLGSNGYQDLCCQLYLRGVYCVETLGPQRTTLTPIDRSSGLFKGWKEVPPIVFLVLVVPREKIRLLEGESGQQLGSPMLHCMLRGTTSKFSNIFSCIRAILGTTSIQGSGSDTQIKITEDPDGWSGTAPLVISVCLPAFNLVVDSPQSTEILLGLHSTPATAGLLVKLGPRLSLFAAKISDTNVVHVTMNRPECTPSVPVSTSSPHTPLRKPVSVSIDGSRVSAMSARWELGTSLKEAKVDHIQISPCVMQVTVANVEKKLVFPFPIDGTRTKIRIARKSGWVEFESPVSPSSGLADFVIPSILVQNRGPVVWNIHRVNLESLPLLQGDTLGPKGSFIELNCNLSLSDRERELVAQETPLKNTLVQVKETIMNLFHSMVHSPHRVFLLADPENGEIYTVIYANGIRMDLASHTYVVDACVLTLTKNLARGPLGPQILNIASESLQINTSRAEAVAWKHLLVAFTERCRSWTHKTTCKYAASGKIPVSTERLQNPLCGCGEGIRLGRLSTDTQWKSLAPFMTRAAISPLFALPYLETVDQKMDQRVAAVVEETCVACNKSESTLLKCSRCREVGYCGKACQKAHWKEHKKVCKVKENT
ncbi:hypothetical protein B0H19DRAFT_930096 [Mycena capillaripes]|nr:hypothetical protein B0H19DRAFT_930096 [Mycena capillaripes]